MIKYVITNGFCMLEYILTYIHTHTHTHINTYKKVKKKMTGSLIHKRNACHKVL
jgi:hypothetical protein